MPCSADAAVDANPARQSGNGTGDRGRDRKREAAGPAVDLATRGRHVLAQAQVERDESSAVGPAMLNSMTYPGSPPPLVVLLRPPRVGRAEMREGARVGRVGPRGEGASMELARTDSLGHCFRRGWHVSFELRQP